MNIKKYHVVVSGTLSDLFTCSKNWNSARHKGSTVVSQYQLEDLSQFLCFIPLASNLVTFSCI